MKMAEIIDTRYLSQLAAGRYEVDTFIERNPGYFKCDQNKERLLDYLTLNGLPLNTDTLEMGYRELSKKGKLVELPTAQELAEMPADKVMKFAKKYGTGNLRRSRALSGL
jgi:hypothetical protein